MTSLLVAIALGAAVGPSAETRDLPALPSGGLQIVNPDRAGGTDRLTTSYWGSGVVLLDFWAVWCAPCVEKLPNLNNVADRLRSQGVKMVGMSIDENTSGNPNPGIVRNFLSSHELRYPTAMVPRDYRRAINAMISGRAQSDVTHNMNVPLMVLVRGQRVLGVLTGSQITRLGSGQAFENGLYNMVMQAAG